MPNPKDKIFGMVETEMTKDSIRTELETARSDFHTMLNSLTEEGWYRQSRNPAWTNGQLLFHITLGYGLIPVLLPIVKLFGRLPPVFSRKFAALLNWSTPFFNWINAIAPRIGARIYKFDALGRKFDKVHKTILKRLYSTRDEEWKLGMHPPVKWDPRFDEFMRLEGFFRYPVLHFRHHEKQFTEE